ncbi:methyl-accepting chemotaxis protein [Aureimonas sp. ME7]|uniref:methyl-accepting chemotaxis protein n=1 Tax=Aureimonas sp. ME7 TaxID=2744252 RepID=UPI0015F526CB|nr:methyl-accepting chemotaxis protein [Aureimonas sp. ME7]
MRLADFRLSRKIAAAFAILVVAAACMGGVVYSKLEAIDEVLDDNGHVNQTLGSALQARLFLSRQENSLRGLLLTREARREKSIATQRDKFVENVDTIARLEANDPDTMAAVDTIRSGIANWHEQIVQPAIGLARDPATVPQAVTLAFSDQANALVEPMEKAIDAITASAQASVAENAATLQESALVSKITLGVGISSLLALAVLLGWALSRGIAAPVNRLRAVMARLAAGDNGVEVPAVERGDEIGEMAKAVLTFRQAAVERVALEAEAEASRRREADERDRRTRLEAGSAEALRAFVMDIEAGFEQLAEGDLRVRLDRPVAPEYEAIRARFNESVSRLDEALGSVVGSIGSIRTGLSEISVASNDLAQRTEQQAASLEETVAALSEVTRGIGETAGGAARAQASAEATRASAQKGGAIVGQAVDAMQAIEQSSEKIGRIIGVIDEIAFQTNLLALNAGVEAARAGEAGRGFAVVAQEVRGLAQRSAEAAKEIKELISTSTAQVGNGVELVAASGRSLEEIVAQVSEMSRTVAEIARSAKEQAVALKEVSTAADQMDKVTQQNAAMVEEATAAAQTLSGETEELGHLAGRFRTGASAGMEPATRRTPPVRPAAPVQRVVQMRTTGHGGAAPAASVDSWEEF